MLVTNWYKMAQQEEFGFISSLPSKEEASPKFTDDEKNWLKRVSPKNISALSDILSSCKNKEEVIDSLRKFSVNFKWELVNFKNGDVIVVHDGDPRMHGSKSYVIDDFNFPELKEANEWLSGIMDHRLSEYVDYVDHNETFWAEVQNGSVLYHATDKSNIDSIMKQGLLKKNETRGMSNKWTGSAVFTSYDPLQLSSYGDLILEIDLWAMKQDGYMPVVELEEPIGDSVTRSKIAYAIGINDYNIEGNNYSDGMWESTCVIFGDIPPKYLKVFSEK